MKLLSHTQITLLIQTEQGSVFVLYNVKQLQLFTYQTVKPHYGTFREETTNSSACK